MVKLIDKKPKKRKRFVVVVCFLLSVVSFFVVLFLFKIYILEPYKWRIITAIPEPFRVVGRTIIREVRDLPYFFDSFREHNLSVYDLKVSQKNLKYLEENIPETDSYLTDEYKDEVPAIFVYNGKEYDVKIRYRGWGKNQWLWPKKSYRIKFKDYFEGRKEMNLIVPIDRLYLNEENNHFRAKQLGLVVPRSKFSVLKINGKSPAVYWETEQFGKDFLETNGLSSDANLYSEASIDEHLYIYTDEWKKYNADTRFVENNFVEIDLLLDLLNNSSNEEFNKNIFNILDEENFYVWSVHNAVSFGQHQDWNHNMRLYFDSSIGKFKMMPWDVSLEDRDLINQYIDQLSNPLVNRILSNPEFMKKRNEHLWDYIKPNGKVEEEFKNLDELFNQVRIAFYQDKIRRMDNKFFDNETEHYYNVLKNNVEFLRGLFIGVNMELNSVNKGENILMSIKTKSLSPIILEEIVINKDTKFGKGFVLNDVIYPNIDYISLDNPDVFYYNRRFYYKAFRLIDQYKTYQLEVNDMEDFSTVNNITFKLKNIYTDEKIEKYYNTTLLN